ncbi:MAG: hypothetical protein HYY49_09815 [Ignavibacteriales bacterium]|nr:hypothetical protein [Ignavibacteriales bacterium]
MLEAAYFWMVIFLIAAMVFFGIAVVVAWKGFEDLRVLLTTSDKTKKP